MVWARNKLLIWDYVFEPVKEIEIGYKGPNPDSLYKKINELIRVIFNVPEAYVQEKTYSWEKGRDSSETFRITWEVTKLFDNFTYLLIEMDLKGDVSGDMGSARLQIKPRMITEYPQDTYFQQNFIYEIIRRFWHVTFYHHQRMEYLDISKDSIVSFESALKLYIEELKKTKTEKKEGS